MSIKFSRIPLSVAVLLSLPLVGVPLAGCATTTDPLGNGMSVETRVRLADLAASAANADTVAAKQQFIRGMGYEVRGEYEQAVEHYRKALALVPQQPAVLMALAEAHRELNDAQAARYYALQAHEADPDDLTYHRQYAELLLQTGDGSGAVEVYQELVARHPDALDALFDLARIQTQMGHLREAIDTYENVLELLGEDAEVRTEMLHVYVRLADTTGIISTLEAMVRTEPYNTSYLRMLAEAYVQNEEGERAVELLQKAHDLDPDDFSLVMKLSEVYRDLGRTEEADRLVAEASDQIQSVDALLAQASAYYARASVDAESGSTAEHLLTRVLTLDPQNADAALMLGSIRFQDGEYADAAEHFETALKVHTGQMQVWFQAAVAHLQAGDAAEAAETAEEGLILFPDQPDLMRVAGYARMETYDNDLAIGHFENLLRVLEEDQPDRPELHAEVLSALAMMHDRVQATEASDSLYRRAIEADPDHALSLNNYAYSLAERNEQLDEALEMAQRAVELEPENPSYLDTLGWIYFQLSDYEQAQEWIGKAIDSGSASAAVHEHMGDVLQKLGETEQARSYYESARELGGDGDRLQEKIERVSSR